MRYLSIFSGIEAASVAWAPLGWEPIAFSEIDPFPSAVLAERFPDVPNLGDITKVDWHKYMGKVEPKEDGFLLSLRIDDLHSRSIYIPCYSDQNGFYSDEVIAVVYDKSGNAINKLTTRGYAL